MKKVVALGALLILSGCGGVSVPEINLSGDIPTHEECLENGGRDAGIYPPACISQRGELVPKALENSNK